MSVFWSPCVSSSSSSSSSSACSMEFQTSTTPISLSGELGNGGRLSRKHVYDGVFGGGQVRKSGAMVEDYAEIFAGSGGSSIPFLDVPELKERQLSGEVAAARGSRVDYSKVFGGFEEAEYAVSHEELFAKHKKSKSFSSRDAGVPNETRFRAPGSYHSNVSEEKQTPTTKASFQSFNEVKQFNTLYHRVSPTNENGTNGTTHFAHLHATPGYTCLIDENRPSQIRQSSRPGYSALNDAHNVDGNKNLKDVNKETKESRPVRKVVSGPQPSVTSELNYRGPAEFQKKSGRNRSFSKDMTFDAFDVGIGLHPSRVLPLSRSPNDGGDKNSASSASMNLNGGVPRIDPYENGSGNYSPPLYEKIDANSAAAASAAAVRKAIEEAQAKIEFAKELMGRKKTGLKNSVKQSTTNGCKAQNRELQNPERAKGSKDKEARGMCDEDYNPGKNAACHVAISRSSIILEKQDEIKFSIAKDVTGAPPYREGRSTLTDNSLKESEDSREVVGERATPSGESKSTDAEGSLFEEAEDWHETVAGETTVHYNEVKSTEAVSSLLEEAEDWHESVGATCYSDESKSTVDNSLSEEAEDWHETVVGETPRLCSESISTEADNILEEAEDWQETVIGETPVPCCESVSTEADSSMDDAEDWKETEEFFYPSVTGENGDISSQFMQEENTNEVITCDDETECLENMIEGEKHMKPKDAGMILVFQEAPKHEKIEGKLNSVEGLFKFDIFRNKTISVMDIQHEGIDEENVKLTHMENETYQTPKASGEQEKYESALKKFQKQEAKTEVQMQELEGNKTMKEAEAQNWIDTGKKEWEELNQKETEKRRDEALVKEDKESRLNDFHQQKENGKVHQESWDRVNHEKLEESWKQEEKKKRTVVHRREQNKENSNEVYKEEVEHASYNDDAETDRNEELKGAKECHMMLEVEYQMNETENRQEKAFRRAESEKMQSNVQQRAEDESNHGATQEALSQENNFEVVDEDVNQGATDEAYLNVEFQREKETVDITIPVNEKTIEASEVPFLSEETGKQSNIHGEGNIHEDQENFENGVLDQDFIKSSGIEKQTEALAEALCMVHTGMSSGGIVISSNGASEDETDSTLENEQYKGSQAENETVYDQKKSTEKVDFELIQSDEQCNEFEVASINERDWDASASNQEEGWLSNEIESHNDAETLVGEVDDEKMHVEEVDDEKMHVEVDDEKMHVEEVDDEKMHVEEVDDEKMHVEEVDDVEMHVEEVAFEQEQNDHQFKESEAATDHAEDGISSESADAEKGEGMAPEISQEITGQNMNKKMENNYETLKMKMETEATKQKKDEAEKRDSRKMEEAKEREIEKEKLRLVVERAIREARERAFVEARERAERVAAERAAAEAQRLKVEAREKLEKASSDASDKLAAEKALREAKLRAERAAVERATTEARERALEKAMSEKTAFKARNQAEKFTGDKFSGASKYDKINYHDQLYKDLGPSSSSRYPNPSNHGVSHSTERSSGADGESAQIYKARTEMHQRTAERAAKALAEKNMRDLLAQKEQAERNRLAQTLDAEVKRWSSGKERNLRALLSTLQYILGPDSGWQPVPLTELISATAVKKAYRKATLFVHPDKLQQRGASIQQKYTCEKVFDLLKEAWNKFSTEEK